MKVAISCHVVRLGGEGVACEPSTNENMKNPFVTNYEIIINLHFTHTLLLKLVNQMKLYRFIRSTIRFIVELFLVVAVAIAGESERHQNYYLFKYV